jgi:DNA invertase Pin-like site-specific DNA recombinase
MFARSANGHEIRNRYYRVSTQRQGQSGLGLEAQRTAVARFVEADAISIAGEFTEVETGKGANALDRRPQLAAALATARQQKCPVLWPSSIDSRVTWPLSWS